MNTWPRCTKPHEAAVRSEPVLVCKDEDAEEDHMQHYGGTLKATFLYEAGCLFWLSAIKVFGPATLNVPHALIDQHYRLCAHLQKASPERQARHHRAECAFACSLVAGTSV